VFSHLSEDEKLKSKKVVKYAILPKNKQKELRNKLEAKHDEIVNKQQNEQDKEEELFNKALKASQSRGPFNTAQQKIYDRKRKKQTEKMKQNNVNYNEELSKIKDELDYVPKLDEDKKLDEDSNSD
jgi:hypothetical protein